MDCFCPLLKIIQLFYFSLRIKVVSPFQWSTRPYLHGLLLSTLYHSHTRSELIFWYTLLYSLCFKPSTPLLLFQSVAPSAGMLIFQVPSWLASSPFSCLYSNAILVTHFLVILSKTATKRYFLPSFPVLLFTLVLIAIEILCASLIYFLYLYLFLISSYFLFISPAQR